MASAVPFVAELWDALGGAPDTVDSLTVVGFGDLVSAYRVTDLACAAIGVAGIAAAELAAAISSGTGAAARVTVDRSTASAWYGSALSPIGWTTPSPWDPLARSYRAGDGWIRLHTNAPHHRRAALSVLTAEPDCAAVGRAVREWNAVDLETAIVEAGGCAAAMLTREQWDRHPQGAAVNGEQLVEWATGTPGGEGERWHPSPARPLAGLKVLDLTRVIAGPVVTRFLAGLGADVLRIDPPGWDEDALVPEMTMGKRAGRLDARTGSGGERMAELIAGCDVLVHGYRNGAMAQVGLSKPERDRLRPGLVEASLDGYGFTGPWSERRGFDSLVQMSSGIAAMGMEWAKAEEPTSLPVQALDHSAGYLLAAAVLRGVTLRLRDGSGSTARTSLARVAKALVDGGALPPNGEEVRKTQADVRLDTPWGPARMLHPPIDVAGTRFAFDRGPRNLGSDDPIWDGR